MNQENVFTSLVDAPIDQASLQDRLEDPDVGAHGWFVGVTRRTTGDRVTTQLSYQAHREMAGRELRKLADAAMRKFELTRIVIVHRVGEVPVGQASVVVGCSSRHRKATFDALPWIMDTLKQEVPIWKQETYADGATEWVHPTGGDDAGDLGTGEVNR